MTIARHSTPTAGLTPAALDQALVRLRGGDGENTDLWQGLLVELRVDGPELTLALQDWHGIAVLDDAQWAQVQLGDDAQHMGRIDAGLVGVSVGAQAFLLTQDPWSTAATLALARSAQAQMQLAWAQGAQWAEITLRVAGQTTGRGGKAPIPQTAQDTPPGLAPAGHGAEPSDVVRFVDEAIAHAYRDGASDIHFETDRSGVGIKYRLDGVMAPGERLNDPQRAEEVVSRIKVMAQLDITERRRPQDGRIHWSRPGQGMIDLRVSVMPSIFGEDVVLRLLDKAQLRQSEHSMSLNALGFDEGVAQTIRDLAARPHGMLLITGPTGSGKTTTVYAALCEVNDGLEKIITIEDPVEYELPGVLQIPVNEQKGLTFATGLRSILRHDPDKILVGEIRDSETAEIAVQSSLTGHLVFTTVHANSLFDVLGRFQHFGIEPFALASALNGVVVQRLMRRICPHCMGWREATLAERNKLLSLDLPVPERLPVAQGCEHCRQTGYRGRFVTAEVHALTDAVRDLIVRRASMSELRAAMYPDPAGRLLAQAHDKVVQGVTTLEEVSRVVGLV